jgi:4-hydroxybutyrate CoA-transferase
VAELVRQGVITGKYKTRHQGKVVASIALVPQEELALIDGNPSFELYEFGYVDDVRYLLQQDNLVAINNALQIDLTGQVASETIGNAVWSGVGGQMAFAIAANYSNGGRSVTVLPSSSLVGGERVSRIVPTLPGGGAVTIPRTLVDYVVTEHGIAHLRGKSVRERAEELIAIAHPDFHAELRREANRAYNIGV